MFVDVFFCIIPSASQSNVQVIIYLQLCISRGGNVKVILVTVKATSKQQQQTEIVIPRSGTVTMGWHDVQLHRVSLGTSFSTTF